MVWVEAWQAVRRFFTAGPLGFPRERLLGERSRGLLPYREAWHFISSEYSCLLTLLLALLSCRRQTLTLANFSEKEFIGRMLGAWRIDRNLEE